MTAALRSRATSNPTGAADTHAYGTKGDGTTDDTAALQAAFTAAAGSFPLYLRPGRYQITAPLVYQSDLAVVGEHRDLAVVANTTTRTGSTAMLEPDGVGVTDVTFSRLSFDQRGDVYDATGDATDDYLASVNATTRATFDDVAFHHARTMALWADAFPANPTTYTTVTRCRVTSAGGGGFSFFGAFTDFEIAGNFVEHTQDDAVAVQSTGTGSSNGLATRGTIAGNTVRQCNTQTSYGSTPHGVIVYGASYVDVTANDIEDTYGNGIQVCDGGGRRAQHVDVTANRVRGAGDGNTSGVTPGVGIFLLGSDYVTVVGNDVAECLDGDFYQAGCTNVTEDM